MFTSSTATARPPASPASAIANAGIADAGIARAGIADAGIDGTPIGSGIAAPRMLLALKVFLLLALYGCGAPSAAPERGLVRADPFDAAAIALAQTAPAARSLTPPPTQQAMVAPPAPAVRRVETPPDPARRLSPESTAGMLTLFQQEGYDLRSVRRGEAGVPRVLLGSLPPDYAGKLRGRSRKAAFLRTVLPLVLEANRKILADRRRIQAVAFAVASTSAQDRAWLAAIETRYRVKPGDIQVLLRRVDAIPTSLALAQAALESGWGTSRFTRKGNALFGQWTWKKGAGITPSGIEGKAKFAIRRFETLFDAVTAYMNNLNYSHAYGAFRKQRAELRRCHSDLTGTKLVGTLTRYSIERETYVRKVRQMIRHNRLQQFDTARFRDPNDRISRLIF